MIKKFVKPTLIIWYREILRYWRTRLRIISSLMMPFIWLVMFGSGISGSLEFSGGGAAASFDYIKFLFPGVLGMTILFTAIFSSITLVRDREFGFLKEIFVAPIPRSSIAFGKILGGATIASIQGLLMIALLPFVGLDLQWGLLLLVPFVFLLATMFTTVGIMISASIKSTESFQMVMQFLTFPMFMLSSALFPMKNIPKWIEVVSAFNPATYGIDMVRKVAFGIFEVPEMIVDNFGVKFFSYEMRLIDDVLVVAGLTIIMIAISTWLFARGNK